MSHHLANQFCALYVRCDLVQIKLAAVLSGWGFFYLFFYWLLCCVSSLSQRELSCVGLAVVAGILIQMSTDSKFHKVFPSLYIG